MSKSNDVTLVAGLDGEKFPVQRNKLAVACPYFRALLGPDYKEATDNEVQIRDIDGPTLKAIIGFCYSGRRNPRCWLERLSRSSKSMDVSNL